MVLIKRNIKLKTLSGDSYEFPKNVYNHIKETKNRADNKFDNVIIITGGVGSGKSNMAKGCCGVYEEEFNKKEYTLDQVQFLIEKVLEDFDKSGNTRRAINYDEAVQGGTGRDGLSKVGFQLRKSLITKRYKRHFLVLCIDNPKELNDKIIERCVCWYHVFYKRSVKGKFYKGLFKSFNKEKLHRVYNDLKTYKYRFVEQHPIYMANKVVYRCPDFSKLWYSEDEYNLRKDEQTKTIVDEKTSKHMEQRDKAVMALIDSGYTQMKIANLIGVSRSIVGDIRQRLTTTKDI